MLSRLGSRSATLATSRPAVMAVRHESQSQTSVMDNRALPSLSAPGQGRKHLVIIGTGWGGYSVLKSVDKKLFDVTVISPRNHFLFTPLLASTTVGTLEFRSIIEPIRNAGFRNEKHFHLAEATGVDVRRNVVKCRNTLEAHNVREYEVKYDHLVIACGAVPNTFGTPGVYEHAFFLKEIADARAIRNRILRNFEISVRPGISEAEQKRLLHIIIVGGGPTGIEFGAELYDFVQQDVRRLFSSETQHVKVTIVEAMKILPSFDQSLQTYAVKKINERRQMTLLHDKVIRVNADSVTLSDGTVVPCGLVVWSTGLAPREFTNNLRLEKNPRGQLVTDGHLMCKGENPCQNVYALGDCADVDHSPLPCTAQAAERAGRYLAKALSERETGKRPSPFVFNNMGMLAYIGEYEALSNFSLWKASGHSAWVLWRLAYATRLGSWRLRMQVPMDWFKSFFFGRDTSRF